MNWEEFNKRLNDLGNWDTYKALTKVGLFLEKEVKQNLTDNDSVVTGTLRRSITNEVKGNTVSVYTNVSYAPYVEYGTGIWAENGDGRQDVPWRYQDAAGNWHSTLGSHPYPFMGPALQENREKINEIIMEEIKKEFTK